jgi:hypothetical protein
MVSALERAAFKLALSALSLCSALPGADVVATGSDVAESEAREPARRTSEIRRQQGPPKRSTAAAPLGFGRYENAAARSVRTKRHPLHRAQPRDRLAA